MFSSKSFSTKSFSNKSYLMTQLAAFKVAWAASVNTFMGVK